MPIRKMIRGIIGLPQTLKNRFVFMCKGVRYPAKGSAKGRIHIVRRGYIQIGAGCKINGHDRYNPIGFGSGCNFITEKSGSILIGENVGISNSTLYSRIGITVGNNVMIGGGTKIYDTDFHSIDAQYRGTRDDKAHTVNKPVIIGDDVFIGAGSVILKGVHIGKGAVIGACSVVTKNVPAGEIWAGNPARFIRKVD